MAKRLIRWVLLTTAMLVGIFTLAGAWRDPLLWGYVAVVSLTTLYALTSISDDLARERFSPPDRGADRLSLRTVRIVALAHVVVGAVDVGRLQLTAPLPAAVRAAALCGMALALLLVYRSMRENRFFSAVVRIQTERGHRVVASGPYAVVRHPGYAGMIAAVPLSGLALGSWASVAVALVYSALILRRVAFEDAFLARSLDGYREYRNRVGYRLVPRVW